MFSLLLTAGLLFAALIAAFTLTWRRYATQPVKVAAKVEGPTCYPRVKR